MKAPPGAIPDSTVINFVYTRGGQEVEFTADKFPKDFDESYKFVRRYDKLIRKGNAEPAIKDFALTTVSGQDSTQQVLEQKGYKLFLFTMGAWPDYHAALGQNFWGDPDDGQIQEDAGLFHHERL